MSTPSDRFVDELNPSAAECAASLQRLGLKRIAVIRAESGACDQAFLTPNGQRLLCRTATQLNEADRVMIERIVAERTFHKIVYVIGEGAVPAQWPCPVLRSDEFAESVALLL